jgi:hypothetical protein
MDSQGDSQVKVVDDAVPKVESQGDSPAADVAVPKARSKYDSPADEVAEDETAVREEIISKMGRIDVAASDWNNRMRDVSIKLSTKIPVVGQAASIILGIFWPVNKVNIFESIKQDIANLVDEKILAKELEERQNEIEALHKIIKEYHDAKMVEKRSWLTRWIADSITLNVKLQRSSNNIHFILPTITLALLHLSGLRERLDYGKEIYGEDNTAVWKNELEKTYNEYVVVYFPEIYLKWKVWRADQVVIRKWLEQHVITIPPFYVNESHATVDDKVSGARRQYYKDWSASLNIFESITNDHKTKMCNDAYTEMAGCLSTTFDFNLIVPDSKDPPYNKEVFGRMFLGPFAEELLMGTGVHGEPRYRRVLDHNDYDANKGSLKQMVIREWNTIDAMQFVYVNGAGRLAGNANGGMEHKLDVVNKYVNGMRMGYSNGLLCFVQVLYRDNTKSQTFGNRGGWRTQDGVANGPPGYKLRSWSYGVNSGPSNTSGPATMLLEYEIQL